MSAAAVSSYPIVARVWKSSIGRKLIVALTGLVLTGFLAGHLAGNLLVYVGREAFNDYAQFLHHMLHGAGVWIARAGLLLQLPPGQQVTVAPGGADTATVDTDITLEPVLRHGHRFTELGLDIPAGHSRWQLVRTAG